MIYGTYRSNAVALTHIPTGIRTTCSEHRSWHKNRDSAWKRLCSLLYARERGIVPSKEVIRTYTLSEDDICPDDLMKYSRVIEKKEQDEMP